MEMKIYRIELQEGMFFKYMLKNMFFSIMHFNSCSTRLKLSIILSRLHQFDYLSGPDSWTSCTRTKWTFISFDGFIRKCVEGIHT